MLDSTNYDVKIIHYDAMSIYFMEILIVQYILCCLGESKSLPLIFESFFINK